MAIPVRLEDQGRQAKITQIGQVVTAPFAYNKVKAVTMATGGTGYNFFPPLVGKQFVVTNVFITALKSITTDVLVDVYETSTLTGTTIDKGILPIEMLKSTFRDFFDLNLLITEGKYLNAKADDDTVLMTILGYYTPKIPSGA